MEHAEQLLREWCERHPGWTCRIDDCSGEYIEIIAHNVTLENSRVCFSKQSATSTVEQHFGSIDVAVVQVNRTAHEVIRAAERWIEANTNEGGGCTPTRR